LIFDKNLRPESFNKIVSNKINNEEERNASIILNFSYEEKKEISNKISMKNYIDIAESDSKEREYLSSFFISRFYKISAYFFGLLFGMNLMFIYMIRGQLSYNLPYKAKEEYIVKFKKITQIKKILFYSLLVYQIGFGLLAIKSYKQYHIMIQHTIPELEKDIIMNNKYDFDKYEKLFSAK